VSSLAPLLEGPLVRWQITVPIRDIVFVKGIFEASEGIGAVLAAPRARYAARADGGALTVVAPESLAHEVAALLEDLRAEMGDALCFERA
jgi:hypothetical protein